ncbi:hypothetical protein E2C01_021147 [Portunus trituberculatus]|uniref:Uncharacterized protein n=1 Tax=Portunus trituberculatus TaxID=210409 RepID=A0A5B7E5A1_PORTR|nr:hypothetical protein [Portunus trituberculatus]
MRCGDGLAAHISHVTTWHPASLLVPTGGLSPAGTGDGQSPFPRGNPGDIWSPPSSRPSSAMSREPRDRSRAKQIE